MANLQGYEMLQTHGAPGQHMLLAYHRTHNYFTDTDGTYEPIREAVVILVTYNQKRKIIDWKAYRGFVPTEMEREEILECVGGYGDKLSKERAMEHVYNYDEFRQTYDD